MVETMSHFLSGLKNVMSKNDESKKRPFQKRLDTLSCD